MFTERELLEPVRLCDEKGDLNPDAVGWSRHPLHTCNLSGRWPRKKRWNYWALTSERHFFSVTLSDVDYIGLAFVYFIDFEAKRMIEKTLMRPLARGCDLGETVRGDLHFSDPSLRVSIAERNGRTLIHVASPDFGGQPLLADLSVECPVLHESMNVVIPWSTTRFQFTSKQQCLPAAGALTLGGQNITFPRGGTFACLDFGRGIWPYRSFWNWASFSGVHAGHTVGVNLGGGWTDGTGLTENALVVDSRVTKLGEDLAFIYDKHNYMRPWTIRTRGTARVELRFEPFFERISRSNLLLLRSEVHQIFGRFSGKVSTAGLTIPISSQVGWAEEHKARW